MPAVSVSGGGGNAPRKGGAVSVSSKRGVDLSRVQSRAPDLQALADANKGLGPVGRALKVASSPATNLIGVAQEPSQIVGSLIGGHWSDAAGHLGNISAALSPVGFVPRVVAGKTPFHPANRTPGQSLRDHGLLPGGKLGAVLQFGADVGLDPTTYVSFGAGAGAKAAMRAAGEAAAKRVAAAAGEGAAARMLAAARAERDVTAARVAHIADHGRTLDVNLRVPFTRGKEIPIVQSRRAGALVDAIARRGQGLPGSVTEPAGALRRVFATTGGTNPIVHDTYQATRRQAEVMMRGISRDATNLEADILRAAKTNGMPGDKALELITRHLDQPGKHQVPGWLAPHASRAKGMLDEWRTSEKGLGIPVGGDVESYVPHMAASRKERALYERTYKRKWSADEFFQKKRELENLDQWDALAAAGKGPRPELNIARLLEARGHASAKKTAAVQGDRAITEKFGAPDFDHEAIAKDWQKVAESHFKDTLVPPDVATAQRRAYERINEAMAGPESIKQYKTFARSLTSHWKGLALLSPGYHVRNAQSDAMAAWWAGARNPQSYVQAVHVLRGHNIQKKVAGRSRGEVLDLARGLGVVNTGQVKADIQAGMAGVHRQARVGVGRFRPSKPGEGVLARGSQVIGDTRENATRLGTFIERLKAGDDPVTAARTTREFHLDYGETSDFIHAARRFWLPFVTYTGKALPLALKEAAKRPGRFSNLGHFQDALGNLTGEHDSSFMPPGSKLSAPLGGNSILNLEKSSPYGVLNSVLPDGAAVNRQPTLNWAGAKYVPMVSRPLGGLLNPFARAAIETPTGFSSYFGDTNPFYRPKATAAMVLADKLGIPVGLVTDKNGVRRYDRGLDQLLNLLPSYGQQARLTPGGDNIADLRTNILKYLGAPIESVDRARALEAERRYRRGSKP